MMKFSEYSTILSYCRYVLYTTQFILLAYKWYDIICAYHMPHMTYIPKSYHKMIPSTCQENVSRMSICRLIWSRKTLRMSIINEAPINIRISDSNTIHESNEFSCFNIFWWVLLKNRHFFTKNRQFGFLEWTIFVRKWDYLRLKII